MIILKLIFDAAGFVDFELFFLMFHHHMCFERESAKLKRYKNILNVEDLFPVLDGISAKGQY